MTFLRCYLDWDDGRQVYDVEFYTEDRKEYDYEIDAYTGDVLSYDYDAEASLIGNTGSGKEITAAEAKSLALAQVPGATESDIWESARILTMAGWSMRARSSMTVPSTTLRSTVTADDS